MNKLNTTSADIKTIDTRGLGGYPARLPIQSFQTKQPTVQRLLTFFAAVSTGLALTACAGSPPETLGLANNSELQPCPSKPNCVVSQHPDDSDHYIAPIAVSGSKDQVTESLLSAINSMDGSKIISQNEINSSDDSESKTYLHVEFQSKLMKFVDDTEFLVDNELIHMRSASRLGYSDLGVNRKRMESVREKMTASQ